MLNWLIANGLYRDLLSAAVLVPIMHVMASKPIQRLEKLINEIRVEAGEKHSLAAIIRDVNKKN